MAVSQRGCIGISRPGRVLPWPIGFQVLQTSTPCTPSPLTTHPPLSACWPAWRHPDDGAAGAADGSMPGGFRSDMGGEGGGQATKQAKRCSRFRGKSWKGGNTEGAPFVVLLARTSVAVPEPCPLPQVRCVRCIFAASAAMLGRWGCSGTPEGPEDRAKWLEVGAELHRDTPAIPTNPQAKRAGVIHDASPTTSMAACKAGKSHGCRWAPGGHSGRLETRQSHGFKISRLNLAGPCRRLVGLGCCPALRFLGAPFPDPSSTTTHTTRHGTGQPCPIQQARDPGSSLGSRGS